MKAPKLVHISSVLFFLICIVQGVFLCIYPTKYLDRGWTFIFLLFFVAASFIAIYLRFQKSLRRRFQWLRENIREWDLKSSLWRVWFVYSIGLVITIAVMFAGVIEGNHEETCQDNNGNFSGTFKDVKICQTKDNQIFFKQGMICGNANETFCWKGKSGVAGLLKKDEFLGQSVLKITLCATPILMLLLLKSARAPKRDNQRSQNSADQTETSEPVEDEDLKGLYFRATLNLFDGMEMLEELLEHGMHGTDVPRCIEITVLVSVCLFYLCSFLELLHLAFRCKKDNVEEATTVDQNDHEREENRKKRWRRAHGINTAFQILLNSVFFGLRITIWRAYKRDAAIFLAKNLISIVINAMPYLIAFGCVDDKEGDDDGGVDGDNRTNGDDGGGFGDDNRGFVDGNNSETAHRRYKE